MKKLVLAVMALMVFILPLTMTYNQQQASANIISKPLTITAKKVAKDLAQDSAVAMANEIVSQYLVRELIEGANVDDGYAAVCMDGAKDNIKDCPADKRAQVKKDLTSSDRSKLASTVESVLERKTNTSAKWQKFLDFFIPIFLISGLVAAFDAMLDGDSESLIDEIAQESLIATGLLKPLPMTLEGRELIDFASAVDAVTVSHSESDSSSESVSVQMILKPGVTIKGSFINHTNTKTNISATGHLSLKHRTAKSFKNVSGPTRYYPVLKHDGLGYNNNFTGLQPNIIAQNATQLFEGSSDAKSAAKSIFLTQIYSPISAQTDVNSILNMFVAQVNHASGAGLNFTLPTVIEKPPEVETDYGTQTGLDKTKNPDGTKTLPGVDSFTYTYNNKYVYPSGDSTTGWKDKTTGEDTTVIEDDVVVDGGPVDPDVPPKEDEETPPNTDKDKDKIKDKSRDWSGLLTDKFPFSLPWDFLHLMGFLFADPMTPKWEIRGTEKIPLNFTIDLKFFDPYAPWFRTFIFISFVVSVIFMHGRFMGGSK